MSMQSRVAQVLERMLESRATPEEACRASPELLPLVRQRWEQINSVEAQLNAVFPKPPAAKAAQRIQQMQEQKRPEIPGYQIGEVLGRGAVGIVYKARHIKLNRYVALKMLLSGVYASDPELKRFVLEAESIASLDHPNLVRVYDISDLDGCPYFTMEFMEGGNLSRKLRGVPLASKAAAELIRTLADAVQAAHHGGIIHRDLKPSNVLLSADGVPKIGDFGLARRMNLPSDLTHRGDRVGTPCYMAPEQAEGRSRDAGPLADVYSLGAILYETLTGRPPFQAESPAETERQLLSLDPVPPSRLNAKVPRDLETVCLKCLSKEPSQRYASPAALSLDLIRFLRGEPIAARRANTFERGIKYIKRRPKVTLLLAGSAACAIAITVAGVRFMGERNGTIRAVSEDLQQVAKFERESNWTEARTAQERAKARMNATAPAALMESIQKNDVDLAIVSRLDAASMDRMRSLSAGTDKRVSAEYAATFGAAGIGNTNDSPNAAADRLNASAIRPALLESLYDWIGTVDDAALGKWLLSVAKRADPGRADWTERAINLDWKEPQAVTQLLNDAPNNPGSMRFAATAAYEAGRVRVDGIPTLKKLQLRAPSDFWITFILGSDYLRMGNYPEAIRYLQAAQALRSDTSVSYENLGIALSHDGRKEEGLEEFKKGLVVNPTALDCNLNLATVLTDLKRYPEAVAAFRHSLPLEVEPQVLLHVNFAVTLDKTGELNEAIDQYKQAIAIDPTKIIDSLLLTDFMGKGRGKDIQEAWQKSLAQRQWPHDAYDGYAELCLFVGNPKAYENARNDLLRIFGNTTDARIAERVGRSCLIMPGDADQTNAATSLINRALNADRSTLPGWVPPYFQFSSALADYRAGEYRNTIEILQGDAGKILGPAAKLLSAMSLFKLGDTDKARTVFEAAVNSYNWSPSEANDKEAWMYHILRGEADQMFLPSTSGSQEPANK